MRRLMAVSARAGIVITGTEVLTGRVQDRNGPWIADRLLELGVELAHITICGDRPADIEALNPPTSTPYAPPTANRP